MSHRRVACEGCGCTCRDCSDPVSSLHLHVEIENLKQRLVEKENHIVSMETNFLKEAEKFPNGEMAAMTDELLTWQDKYSRLYEAHKRVQKVNQNLEDKLLKIVDKCETEKSVLTAEVAALTRRLVDEKFNVSKLQEENERYRNDVNLAIQLLQCKPANFVPQKYDSLPIDLQQKVRSYVTSKRRISIGDSQQKQPEMKTIKVPIPTFPPTAMVYSVNKSDEKDSSSNGNEEKNSKQGSVDIVSAAIMAKVLEEREKERSCTKHCDTCTCSTSNEHTNNNRHHNKGTQTLNSYNNLIMNEPNIFCSNCSSSSSNCGIDNPSSINMNNSKNVYKVIDSGNKNMRSGSNQSIVSSGSSPMNVKRNKNLSANGNISLVRSSSSTTTASEKRNVNQTDYFSDFNMAPFIEQDYGGINCSNNNKTVKNDSADNFSLAYNKLLPSDAVSTGNSDVLIDDKSHRNNIKANFDNNSSVGCLNSNGDDETNDLIVFDKHSPPFAKNSANSLSKGVVNANTTSNVNISVGTVTAPVSTLTVLGGNLNISSSTVGNRTGSARHCSVRLQAGTSNILLDNVVNGPYAPVLYKSRQQPASDPLLVHVPPSRSLSASSSVSSCCNDDQRNSTDVINSVNSALQSMSFSSSTSSSSSSSSTSSTSSSSVTPSSHKNLILAQLRTETEI